MKPARSVSPTRVAAVLALGAWGSLFWFLILTHRSALYLSPRVSWTIPFGAALLTAATLAQLVALRSERPEPFHLRSALILTLIVLPAVVIMALPPVTLGSFAASRRSTLDSDVAKQIAEKVADQNSPLSSSSSSFRVDISLAWVGAALRSDEGFTALSRMVDRQGPSVSFVGVVTKPKGTAPGEFVLVRFVVACCIADAVSVQVRVVGTQGAEFKPDEWVEVQGDLQFEGRTIFVRSSSVDRIPPPDQPYLWASG